MFRFTVPTIQFDGVDGAGGAPAVQDKPPVTPPPVETSPVVDPPVDKLPDGSPPAPTPEQQAAEADKTKREAYYQQQYQIVAKRAKEIDPGLLAHLKGESEPVSSTPASPASTDPDIEGGDKQVLDMTAEELTKTIQAANEVGFRKATADSQRADSLRRERELASESLNEMAVALQLTPEQFQQVAENAAGYGIDVNVAGGPSRFAKAMADNMRLIKGITVNQDRTDANSIAAEEQARKLALTQQPQKGAGIDPGAKTEKRKLTEKLAAAGPIDLGSLLDSGKAKPS